MQQKGLSALSKDQYEAYNEYWDSFVESVSNMTIDELDQLVAMTERCNKDTEFLGQWLVCMKELFDLEDENGD